MSAKGNVLGLTLVRGPMYPDMLADEGVHDLTYAILPTGGLWWDAEVQAEADLLGRPAPRRARPGGRPRPRAARLGGRAAAPPRAEARAGGRRASCASPRPPGGAGRSACGSRTGSRPRRVDGLERAGRGAADGPLRPFELRSIRLG